MGTTAAQKKLFFNLRKVKSQIDAIEDGDLNPEQLAEVSTRLGVSEADVISMNRRMAGPDNSLNAPLKKDGDSGEWQDWLVDEKTDQETTFAESQEMQVRSVLLGDAMKDLNERERDILEQRRLSEEPKTLEQLSKVYDISRERVRQIEVRAFEKVQKAVRNAARDKRMPVGA